MTARNDAAQCLYLTEKQLAQRLNISVKWLQAKRLNGGGIPYAKFGSNVRYALSDIEEFEVACRRESTSQQASPCHTHAYANGAAHAGHIAYDDPPTEHLTGSNCDVCRKGFSQ